MGMRVSASGRPLGIKAPEGQKWCAKCRDWRPRTQFFKNKARADGLTVYCRSHHMALCIMNQRKAAVNTQQSKALKELLSLMKEAR